METQVTIKGFFDRTDVRKKFEEMLGKRAPQFITSVLQIATQNQMLAKADPVSIYNSAAVAATLDLPLNANLGFAYIVPYNSKQKDGTYKVVAQFQMGYKGFIQLAQRSGQFQTISSCPVYEGQIVEQNPLKGFIFDFTQKKSDIVIGYAAYFRLINGFEKTMYMTVEELKKHGTRYSQTFKSGYGLWKDDFDAMASKTVLKLLLSKFAPLSIDMQKAVVTDQAIVNDFEGEDVTYVDNQLPEVNKELERMTLLIQDCKTLKELKKLESRIPNELNDIFIQKLDELTAGETKAEEGKLV
jgi:recombination protein RecT